MESIEKTLKIRLQEMAEEPDARYSKKFIEELIAFLHKVIYSGWELKDIIHAVGIHPNEHIYQHVRNYYDYHRMILHSDVGRYAFTEAQAGEKDYVKLVLEKQARWSNTTKHELKDTTESFDDHIKKMYDNAKSANKPD